MTIIYDNGVVRRRLKHVLDIDHGDKTIAQAAREASVSWKTMKSWFVRHEHHGIKGLLNRPRGKYRPPDDETRALIVDLKTQNRYRSARKIRDLMARVEGLELHRQTVWRVLREAGESRRAKRRLKHYRDFERRRPNSLWQIDYMDGIVIEGYGMVYLVLIIDDYSRQIIGAEFSPDRSAVRALTVLWNAIERHGIPSQIYSDQGRQLRSHLGRGYSHYERVCRRLGIQTIHGTPRYPEGRGKIERLFGFIQDDFLTEFRFTGLEDINQKFRAWMKWYGAQHEHSALGGKPPGSRYRDFVPRKPEGDLFTVFSERATRKVRKNATISYRGRVYPVDPRFIREKVEVRAFGNDLRIYAHSELLGEYDTTVDYHEKLLRRTYTRLVRRDGTMKFRNVRYPVGREFVGQRVEILVVRDQLRAFLSTNRLVIFKLGEGDAVVVRLDR